MKRRDFLKSAVCTSVAAATTGAGSLFTFSNAVASNGGGITVAGRTLVNLMLLGGADQRFLLVPEPGTAYATKFWEKRQSIYRHSAVYSSYEDVWNDLYLPTTHNGQTFGIHKNAQWLWDEFNKGNVAFIANMVASENRRHDHSQLIMHTGDLNANSLIVNRDGWGGRLVYGSGISDNAVCMSHDVPPYCLGINNGNRLEKVIHVRDSRNLALPDADPATPTSSSSIVARALKAYYSERGQEIEAQITDGVKPENWPFRRFFQHERAIRQFGGAFRDRLQAVKPNLSADMLALLSSTKMNNKVFGQQIINLYDSMLAADILQLKSAYIEYAGWDSHSNEKSLIEGKILDVFGSDKALDTLHKELGAIQGANENMVYVVTSDFGRQIAANGDGGTDHGVGTYGIVIGDGVNGGLYGEMFPQSEITPDGVGEIRFDKRGADIEGRTSFEWVLGAACDWVAKGSGSLVFPNLANTANPPKLETGVNISALFKSGYMISGTVSVVGGNHISAALTATSSSGETTDISVDNNYGHYHISALLGEDYIVTPHQEYFTFEPPQAFVQSSSSDVYNVDFTAIPQLQIQDIYKWETLGQIFITGYNFVLNNTQITVGGIAGVISSSSETWMWVELPAGVTAGEIVITTPTETYGHNVLYEDVPVFMT